MGCKNSKNFDFGTKDHGKKREKRAVKRLKKNGKNSSVKQYSPIEENQMPDFDGINVTPCSTLYKCRKSNSFEKMAKTSNGRKLSDRLGTDYLSSRELEGICDQVNFINIPKREGPQCPFKPNPLKDQKLMADTNLNGITSFKSLTTSCCSHRSWHPSIRPQQLITFSTCNLQIQNSKFDQKRWSSSSYNRVPKQKNDLLWNSFHSEIANLPLFNGGNSGRSKDFYGARYLPHNYNNSTHGPLVNTFRCHKQMTSSHYYDDVIDDVIDSKQFFEPALTYFRRLSPTYPTHFPCPRSRDNLGDRYQSAIGGGRSPANIKMVDYDVLKSNYGWDFGGNKASADLYDMINIPFIHYSPINQCKSGTRTSVTNSILTPVTYTSYLDKMSPKCASNNLRTTHIANRNLFELGSHCSNSNMEDGSEKWDVERAMERLNLQFFQVAKPSTNSGESLGIKPGDRGEDKTPPTNVSQLVDLFSKKWGKMASLNVTN